MVAESTTAQINQNINVTRKEVGIMNRVLILDDDLDLREYLQQSLTTAGFEVIGISEVHSLLSQLKRFSPELLLLDVHMPEMNGVEVVKSIRSYHETRNLPIIMISGDSKTPLKVKTLELGADDYLVKPFSQEELVARINAVLRRSPKSKNHSRLEAEGLEIDQESHRVLYNGQEVGLTLTEYRILCELIQKRGKVLSRNDLRRSALNNLNVTDRTIDVHMTSLRKKIGHCSRSIKTVRGVGYLFIKNEMNSTHKSLN